MNNFINVINIESQLGLLEKQIRSIEKGLIKIKVNCNLYKPYSFDGYENSHFEDLIFVDNDFIVDNDGVMYELILGLYKTKYKALLSLLETDLSRLQYSITNTSEKI